MSRRYRAIVGGVMSVVLCVGMAHAMAPVHVLAETSEEVASGQLEQSGGQANKDVVGFREKDVPAGNAAGAGETDPAHDEGVSVEDGAMGTAAEELSARIAEVARTSAPDSTADCIVTAAYQIIAGSLANADIEPDNGLAQDVREAARSSSDTSALFSAVMAELGIPAIEVEAGDGTRWNMVQVGDLWYHVDTWAAASEAGGSTISRERDWLLISDATVRLQDPTRRTWTLVGEGELPIANSDFVWAGGGEGQMRANEQTDDSSVGNSPNGSEGSGGDDNGGLAHDAMVSFNDGTIVTQGTEGVDGEAAARVSAAADNQRPVGWLDEVSGGDGSVRVRGWAYDPDAPSSSIDVHVYVGGPAETGERHIVRTNVARSDVNQTMGVSGNHGFEVSISTSKRGSQKVYAYAIDTQHGDNPQLSGCPKEAYVSTVDLSGCSVLIADQKYTGSAVTPAPVVKVGGTTLSRGTDYTVTYANNVSVGTATVTVRGTGGYKGSKSATFKIYLPSAHVAYRTHVQTFGWQGFVRDGAMSGTSGQSKRLEGIEIKLEGAPYSGGIEYRTHVQTYGWQGYRANGAMSGTSGESKRLEAIQIRLTGTMAQRYDVWYRVHAQTYGWLDWAKNDYPAGTAGLAKRLEGIEIRILPKGSSAPGGASIPYVNVLSVSYRTHVQTYGWQSWRYDGQTSGTSGQSKRLEAIRIAANYESGPEDIQYRTHVQTYGWQGWKSNGQVSGTSGESKRLEAIQIRVGGRTGRFFDVWYRVHCQNFGWMGWAKNGESAGTEGYAYRLEAIQVVLRAKGSGAPGSTANAFRRNTDGAYTIRLKDGYSFVIPQAWRGKVTYDSQSQSLRYGSFVILSFGSYGTIQAYERSASIREQYTQPNGYGAILYAGNLQRLALFVRDGAGRGAGMSTDAWWDTTRGTPANLKSQVPAYKKTIASVSGLSPNENEEKLVVEMLHVCGEHIRLG